MLCNHTISQGTKTTKRGERGGELVKIGKSGGGGGGGGGVLNVYKGRGLGALCQLWSLNWLKTIVQLFVIGFLKK